MAEGGGLAGPQLFEVDDVLGEEVFVFEGEADVVKSSVIGADGDVDSGIKAAIKDGFEGGHAGESAGLEIGGWADLKALVSFC